jgi:dTDP-4-dehydrorhamnose 3,5-epimerase
MAMKAIPTAIPEVLLIEPKVFGDARGFFYESWNRNDFSRAVGREVEFVQDNHSASARNVLRGLHYQVRQTQGKLVRVVAGEVFDVAVDMRRASPTFGRWVGERLSAANRRMLWVPEGFAHGFLVLSDMAEFLYKATDYYAPEHERSLAWNDPRVGIDWPLEGAPLLKPRDAAAPTLDRAETFA